MSSLQPSRSASPSDEGALIAAAQQGDAAAFDELCARYGNRLFQHALGLCRSRSNAEDLVQETLVRAWRSLPRYHGKCQLFTWLCSILIHRHQDLLRKRIPIPFSWLFAADPEEEETDVIRWPDPAPNPSEAMESAERAARTLRSLDALPPKQRTVVFLRFYADETLEGIAAVLGCSVGTVKSRLFHGLERLRIQLSTHAKEPKV